MKRSLLFFICSFFFLSISQAQVPANDLCADAETISANQLDCVTGGGGIVSGTTFNATADATWNATCISPGADVIPGVWYSFTAIGYDLIINDLEGTAPTIVIVDNCTAVPTEFFCDQVPTTYADGNNIPLTLGNSYLMWVGFDSGVPPDTFNLCMEFTPPPANDDCTDAIDITGDLDCALSGTGNSITGTTIGSFPDFDFPCVPGINNTGVWYSFVAQGYDFFIEDIMGNSPYVAIVDACTTPTLLFCEQVNPIALIPDINLTNGGNDLGLTIGTTYYIWVGFDDGIEQDFELCFENSEPPDNDDPCDAEVIPGNTVINGTSIGATEDFTNPNCDPGDQFLQTVWYEYTVPPGIFKVVIEINSNEIGSRAQIVVTTPDCNNPLNIYEFCNLEEPNFVSDTFCVVPDSTYLIQLGLAQEFPGDFTIEVFEADVTECTRNNICEFADDLGIIPSNCEIQTIEDCNYNACPNPEMWTCAGNPIAGSIAWYSFMTDNNEPSHVDLIIDNTTFGDATIVFFDECDPVNIAICAEGTGGVTELLDVDVDANTTYYFAVADPVLGGLGGEFDINIQVYPRLDKDTACTTYEIFGAPGGLVTLENNFCTNDDTPAWEFNDCDPVYFEATSWYYFIPTPETDAVIINIDAGGVQPIVDPMIQIMQLDDACVTGTPTGIMYIEDCDAATLPFEFELSCYTADTIYIRIGSEAINTGEFNITLDYIDSPCADRDSCEQLSDPDLEILMPETDPTFSTIEYVCIDWCLEYACEEETDPVGDFSCDFTQFPTVWFMVVTDNIAAQMLSSVTTEGSWNPMWSVWYGECDNLTNAGTGGVPPCSNGDNTPFFHQTGVETLIDTYYIAISPDPNGPPVDDPEFELCVATIINVLVCLGDEQVGCGEDDPSLVMEVTEREYPGPLTGPFCPGEEVNIHIQFFYDATESGADWFHGFCPRFGAGWDIENFDFAGNTPTGNGSPGEWHEEGPCAATIQEPVPHLCTFRDQFGVLQICNALCEICTPDCVPGMVPNDTLPNGYFWLANGSNAGCVANSCSPGHRWGIGSTTATVTWDFTISVREFANTEECLEDNDLQISFLTFSDGGAGCWEDPVGECLIDYKQFGPTWEVNCNLPPELFSNPHEICSGDDTDIYIETEDGSTYNIEITFVDNPNVEGENNHTLIGGSGDINDFLTTESCGGEEVLYLAEVIAPDIPCASQKDSIIVRVFAPPVIYQEEVPVECHPHDFDWDITQYIDCGYPGTLAIEWEHTNGTTGTGGIIHIDESFGHGVQTFTITVTDSLGCAVSGDIQINLADQVYFELGDSLEFCLGDDEIVTLEPTITLGTPNEYSWTGSIGSQISSTQWEIDIMNVGIPGVYDIILEIVNIEECPSSDTITVTIHPDPEFFIIPNDIQICDQPGSYQDVVVVEVGITEAVIIEWLFPDQSVQTGELIEADQIGWYAVKVTDQNGCVKIENFEVTAFPQIPPEITGDNIICDGASTILSVNNSYAFYNWTPTGEQTPDIIADPSAPTTYVVQTEDFNGCFGTDTFFLDVASADLVALPDTQSFCPGGSTILDATGGYVSYEWSNSSGVINNLQSFTTSDIGDYYVMVVDSNGCSSNDTVTVTEEANLNLQINGDLIVCELTDSTLISVLGTYVHYTWYNSSGMEIGDESTMYLTPGSYTVEVQDASDCEGSLPIVISTFPPYVPTINGLASGSTFTICLDADTVLWADTQYVSYQWSNSGFNDTIFNIDPGNYDLTVTDENGCEGVATITIDTYADFDPEISGNLNICPDGSTTLGVVGGYDYYWIDIGDDGIIDAEGDLSINFQVSDADVISITAQDANGCLGSNIYNTNYYPLPDPGLAPNTTFCTGFTATLQAGAGFNAYEWFDELNTSIGNSQTQVVGVEGYYYVEIVDTNGCTNRDTIFVEEAAELEPWVQGVEDICDADIITLTAGGVYDTYAWINSSGATVSTDPTYDVTSANAGTYTLEVTSAGCAGDTTIAVAAFVTPSAVVSEEATICGLTSNNGVFVIDFTDEVSGDPGFWTDLDGAGVDLSDLTNVDFSNVPAGTYIFTYTTNTATPPCVDPVDSMIVEVEICNCPFVDLDEPDALCNTPGSTLDINDILTTAEAGTWSLTVNPNQPNNPLTGTVFDANGVVPGDYEIEFALTTPEDGCDTFFTETITVYATPNSGIESAPINYCVGEFDLIDLHSLLTDEDIGGVWTETSVVPSESGAFDNSNGTFEIDFQQAGTYEFTYSLAAQAPCVDQSSSVQIVLDPIPISDAGIDVTLDCIIEGSTIGGSGSTTGSDISYEWSTVTGGLIPGETESTLYTTEEGLYIIQVRDDGTGCLSMDTMQVYKNEDFPVLDIDADSPSCPGDSNGYILITPSGGSGPYTISLNNNEYGDEFNYQNLGPGIYGFSVMGANGCVTEDTLVFEEPVDLNYDIISSVLVDLGDTLNLELLLSPDSIISEIIWSWEDNIIQGNFTEINLIPTQTTDMLITIIDINGCEYTDFVKINVFREIDVYIPNVFNPSSPNPENSVFTVFTDDQVARIDLIYIFDRWGNKVFEDRNIPVNDPTYGWDGTFKGEEMNPAVFVYKIKLEFIDGTFEWYSGDVTLMR